MEAVAQHNQHYSWPYAVQAPNLTAHERNLAVAQLSMTRHTDGVKCNAVYSAKQYTLTMHVRTARNKRLTPICMCCRNICSTLVCCNCRQHSDQPHAAVSMIQQLSSTLPLQLAVVKQASNAITHCTAAVRGSSSSSAGVHTMCSANVEKGGLLKRQQWRSVTLH
eukprot:9784-Heterococcus_DN1.PRE.2